MTLRLPSPGTKPDPTPVPRILAALLVVLAWAFPTTAQVPPAPTGREFPPGSWSRLSELPDGPFRRQLERAPDAVRGRALERLRRFHFTAADLPSLRLDAEGGVYYADGFPGSATATTAPATSPLPSDAAVPVSPFPAGLVLHSRPGAANVLFLNFSGETVSGTAWNSDLGRSQIPATAFSTDADATTFSTAEQDAIRRIWQRVSEDYAPFNIDVTTERPGTFNNRTAHLLVTRNTDANGSPNPSSTAGGVAYVDVFGRNGYATYRPAWVYANNLGNAEANISEAASHEVGHNLGLSHDGTTAGSEYYGGHGSGDISWGPLMGAPYGRNVTQWSRGDYRQANNSQDDLAILASKVGYRPDDHGNTPGTATPVVVGPDGAIRVTTPEDDPDNTDAANQGVLERSGDVDVFSLVSGTGRLVVDIAPWRVVSGTTRGGNADLQVELRDAAGSLVAIDDPPARTTARLDVVVPEGAYYLHIRGTGTGDPLATTPTGYVPYGSLGQYFLSGQLVPSGFILPPIAELQSGDLTRNGLAEWEFNVTYSDDVAIATATLDDNDLRVTGPAGYDRPARLVRVDAAGDGSPRIATYAAPPPDGNVWIPADNGTYTILLTDGQVSDTTGATAIGGPLGAFQVAIPAAVYAASLDSDPGWTLEGLWAYGLPRYPGAGPTGGRTGTRILAYNLSGNYENRLNPTWATTPPIDCSGASTLTLRFQRWLRLRNGDTATVQVSTNGTDWADLWSTRRTVSDSAWREIQLALPRWTDGASALRLRWGITSGASQSDIGWNLDDIEVLSGGTLDTRPPTPAFSAADVTLPGATTHSFTVTYTDDSAVAVASLGSGDLEVLDPAGSPLAVTLEAVDPAGDGTPRTATYSVGAPGGVWDPDDNGTYQVLLLENEVGDLANNLTPAGILGTFAVSIPVDPLTLLVTPAVLPVEEGRQAGFLVRANRPPAGPLPVEIRRISGDPDLELADGGPFRIDTANWADGFVVPIRALPDADEEAGSATFEFAALDRAPVTAVAQEVEPPPGTGFELTVRVNDPAWGSVTPPGGRFPSGTGVDLLATPADFHRFEGWTGDVTTAENPLRLTLDRDLSVGAVFAEILTANHPTPLWWLDSVGITNDFESAVDRTGANGLALWESYQAGLDPDDPDSGIGFRLTASDPAAPILLEWDPVAGRVYTILFAATPDDPFLPVEGAVDLPPEIRQFDPTHSAASGNTVRFFRLQVRKP